MFRLGGRKTCAFGARFRATEPQSGTEMRQKCEGDARRYCARGVRFRPTVGYMGGGGPQQLPRGFGLRKGKKRIRSGVGQCRARNATAEAKSKCRERNADEEEKETRRVRNAADEAKERKRRTRNATEDALIESNRRRAATESLKVAFPQSQISERRQAPRTALLTGRTRRYPSIRYALCAA